MVSFSFGYDSGDESGGGRCNPLCSICAGIILIVVAPYVIWNVEGDYVKTLEALDAAGKTAIQPCRYTTTGRCEDCMESAQLKEQDAGWLVFLSCEFANMKTLTDLQKDFPVSELAPMVNGVEKAVKYQWKSEMYQWRMTNVGPFRVDMDIDTCPAAAALDDDLDPDMKRRRSLCCNKGQPGYNRFKANSYGRNKACHPYKNFETEFGQALVAQRALAANVSEAPAPRRLSSRRREGRRREDDSRRRRTNFGCDYPCYQWRTQWWGTDPVDPQTWSQLPLELEKVQWLEGPPAANLASLGLASISYLSEIKLGVATVENFWPIADLLKSADSAARLSQKQGAGGTADLSVEALPVKLWQGKLNVEPLQRKSKWTAATVHIASDNNCLASRRASQYQAGDLRMCFQRTDLTKATVIAELQPTSTGFELVVSKTHLRAKTRLRSDQQGYRLREGEIMSLDELMEAEKSGNETKLWVGRVVGPLILWLAFYCFLQPILWLMDKFGDTLENIPCVGGFLGYIADFIETLVSCLICLVSCSLGLACGLFAMAVAWLYYNPFYGIVLLAISGGLFGAVAFLAMKNKGAPKVRRRSSARQSPVGAAVELQSSNAQPAVATAVAQPTLFQVQCPADAGPGSQVLVSTPDGRQVAVQVPAGVQPGQMFQVQA